jgi:hypothetical protein
MPGVLTTQAAPCDQTKEDAMAQPAVRTEDLVKCATGSA